MYTNKLTIGVVDLTNIDLATEEDKRYNIDKWAMFFKAQTWEELDMITEAYPEMIDSTEYVHKVSDEEHFRQQCAAREDAIRRENGLKLGLEAATKEIARQAEEISDLKDEIARLKAQLTEAHK